MSWISRNRTVGWRFSFCAWPLNSLVWIPDETGHLGLPGWLSFTAPTQLLWRHQAAVLFKHTHGPTAYFDSWKLESETLWAPVHLNWSDQKRKTRWFCLLPLPCSKQFNRKQIPLTQKYSKHEAGLSWSQFYRTDVITKTVITKSWDPGSVTLVGENARRGSCHLCCEYSKTANGFFNF